MDYRVSSNEDEKNEPEGRRGFSLFTFAVSNISEDECQDECRKQECKAHWIGVHRLTIVHMDGYYRIHPAP